MNLTDLATYFVGILDENLIESKYFEEFTHNFNLGKNIISKKKWKTTNFRFYYDFITKVFLKTFLKIIMKVNKKDWIFIV